MFKLWFKGVGIQSLFWQAPLGAPHSHLFRVPSWWVPPCWEACFGKHLWGLPTATCSGFHFVGFHMASTSGCSPQPPVQGSTLLGFTLLGSLLWQAPLWALGAPHSHTGNVIAVNLCFSFGSRGLGSTACFCKHLWGLPTATCSGFHPVGLHTCP